MHIKSCQSQDVYQQGTHLLLKVHILDNFQFSLDSSPCNWASRSNHHRYLKGFLEARRTCLRLELQFAICKADADIPVQTGSWEDARPWLGPANRRLRSLFLRRLSPSLHLHLRPHLCLCPLMDVAVLIHTGWHAIETLPSGRLLISLPFM